MGQDIITYMEEISEVEDAIMDVVDKKSSPFVDRQVKQMYSLANDCLQPKKQRPHMKQVRKMVSEMLHECEMRNPWSCSLIFCVSSNMNNNTKGS